MMTPGKPFETSRLAKYVTKRILQLRPKTQAELAAKAGFVNVNMLAMIKLGTTRLPPDRVISLAKVLEVDPAYLLLLALEQMVGSTEAHAIVSVMNTSVTQNEMDWVRAIRDASEVSDPPLTKRGRAAIFGVFGR